MYYIINQTNQIIAADDALLKILCVKDINELVKQIILDKIHFTALETETTIHIPDKIFNFTSQTSSLSSILGIFTLVHLTIKLENEEEILTFTVPTQELNESNDSFTEKRKVDIPEDLISPVHNMQENNLISPDDVSIPRDETQPLADIKEVEDLVLINEIPENFNAVINNTQDDELFSIKDNDTLPSDEIEISKIQEIENLTIAPSDDIPIKKEPLPVIEETELGENELFNLTVPQLPEETIDEISISPVEITNEPKLLDTDIKNSTPIIININEVSQSIGISHADYELFLNEYIDTAISVERDLQSQDKIKRSNTIETLIQLADVLELPTVNELMNQLKIATPESSTNIIESFYTTLSRFTTEKKDTSEHEEKNEVQLTLDPPSLEKNVSDMTEMIPQAQDGFGTIDLTDVKPIQFAFRLEEAANDLSLPIELIEEFVHDFITQAHEETKKMLLAYEIGDITTIQNIGHMLKGASSNLRIGALSDKLYEIQFCEDSTKLEKHIKQYWGHFLSFEQQINMLSK